MTITTDDARGMVGTAVRRIVPDADLAGLAPEADLRQAFELDSLDFLSFVELLTQQSGVRIDEEDYPELRSLDSCVRFLRQRSAG
jgi:acyl carrier protein